VDEDDARDEIEAAQMHYEMSPRRTLSMIVFSFGLIVWLFVTINLNNFIYDATQTSLFPGIVCIALMEILAGLILYYEFHKWADKYIEE
jgi:uncharacterized protein with PQ loop repeat